MSDQPVTVLLYCTDLMMTSSVSNAALQLGVEFHQVSTQADLASLAARFPNAVCLFDLSAAGPGIVALAQTLSDQQKANSIAYGPHVQTSLLETADAAGIGTVLSRGAFTGQLQSLLKDRILRSDDVSEQKDL